MVRSFVNVDPDPLSLGSTTFGQKHFTERHLADKIFGHTAMTLPFGHHSID
jgi:hypothetical protein